MAIDPRIEQALSGPKPLDQLRSLVGALQSQRQPQERIIELFEQARKELRAEGRDVDEDVVLELMDFLVGWCSPQMSLKPGE